MNLEVNNKLEPRNYLYQSISSLTPVINNIKKVALPIIALITLSHIPIVICGQKEYDDCVEQCDAMAQSVEYLPYAFSYPVCVAGCFFLLRI